jgi:AraC-like DNA-binding protein
MATESPIVERDVTGDVRRTIVILMGDGRGSPDIEVVASAVGVSVRTLQRRLRQLGTSYADVARQVRCDAALRMLRSRERTIGQIARTLGYADHPHFTRAFLRWMGVTPREFRRRISAAPPDASSDPHP